MMQNMRQVGEIFLCYRSIHKQPPLTAAGKCRITRFKTRKGGTESLCTDQSFRSPEIRMFCQIASGAVPKPWDVGAL